MVAAGVEPKTAANWVMGDVMTTFNETGAFPVEAAPRWPAWSTLVREGVVSHQAAKRVYTELAQRPGDEPKAVAERLGLVQVSDQGALGSWVDEVLAAYPAEVARYRGGRNQADGVLRRAGDEEEQGQGGSEGRAAGAAGEAGVDPRHCHPERSEGGHVRYGPLRFAQGDRLVSLSLPAEQRHRIHRRSPRTARSSAGAGPSRGRSAHRADHAARRDRVAAVTSTRLRWK